ncbi:MAG: hypothetical protein RL208_488 [Pseudomonadota bacterium]
MNELEFINQIEIAKNAFSNKLQEGKNKIQPFANYIPAKQCNNLIYISGQLPKDILNDDKIVTGYVKSDDDIYFAKYASVMCGMQILLALNEQINNLNNVKSCVQLQVFVNSGSSFCKQHLIANGASDFICESLGLQKGQHSRFAVGVCALPLGAIVEIGAIFEV